MGLAERVRRLEQQQLWRYAERPCANYGGNPAELLAESRKLGAVVEHVGFYKAVKIAAAEHGVPLEEVRCKYAEIRRELEAEDADALA